MIIIIMIIVIIIIIMIIKFVNYRQINKQRNRSVNILTKQSMFYVNKHNYSFLCFRFKLSAFVICLKLLLERLGCSRNSLNLANLIQFLRNKLILIILLSKMKRQDSTRLFFVFNFIVINSNDLNYIIYIIMIIIIYCYYYYYLL